MVTLTMIFINYNNTKYLYIYNKWLLITSAYLILFQL